MCSTKLLASNATEVAEIIRRERGSSFKADWHGAYDEFPSEGKAEVVYINDGRGYLQGINVSSSEYGNMFYLGPFHIEQMPSPERMFLFRCAGAMLVRPADMGPPPR